MKNFSKKAEETKTTKTEETKARKITEKDLDSVEREALNRLATHLVIRRVLKEAAEEAEEKTGDFRPRRTLHSALDETGNPWDELFGKDDDDMSELEKLFRVSPEHRIHIDPNAEAWDDDEDDDDDDDNDEDDAEESATNEFLREHYIPNKHGKYVPRPRAKCADGYSVSIQAGSGAGVRCWPNEDTDKFTHVALDMPSCVDEELLPYRYDLDDPEEIFYFFVPIEVMDKVLEKHGGIVGTETVGEFLVKKMFEI